MSSLFATMAIAFTIVGCAAGEPQTDAIRDEAMLELWPISTTSEEARAQVADGLREMDMDRQDEALAHFERAIAADPNLGSAYAYAAMNAVSAQDGFKYVDRATQLIDGASQTEKLLINIMKSWSVGDNEGARTLAEQLVRETPQNPRSWGMLANADSIMFRVEEARASLLKAVDVAPDYSRSYVRLSISYAQNIPNDYAKAEQYARKAVELEPSEPVAHDILGDALRAQGKLEEAGTAYTSTVELDPTDGNGLQQRGHVNSFLNRFPEARADYDAAMMLSKSNERITFGWYRAFVHCHEGNPRGAFDELEQLYNSITDTNVEGPIEARIGVAGQQLTIARYLRQADDVQRIADRLVEQLRLQAAQVNNAAFTRTQNSVIAQTEGYALLARGDFAGAKQKAADMIRLREPDRTPDKNMSAHELLGFIALEEKHYSNAADELAQAAPTEAYIQFNRAVALDKAGRKAEADALYKRMAAYFFNSIGNSIYHRDAVARLKSAS